MAVDYEKLAKEYGGAVAPPVSQPPTTTTTPRATAAQPDYAALAAEYGGAIRSEIPQRQGLDLAGQWAGVINRAVAPYLTAQAVAPGLGPLALGATDITASLANLGAAALGREPVMQTGSEAIRQLYPEAVMREPETPTQAIVGSGLEAATGATSVSTAAGQTANLLRALRSQPGGQASVSENVLRELGRRPDIQAVSGFAAGAAPQASIEYSEPGSIMQSPLVLATMSALAGAGTAKVSARGPQIIKETFGVGTPSLEQTTVRARQLYNNLDRSGVAFSPIAMDTLGQRVSGRLAQEGFTVGVNNIPAVNKQVRIIDNLRNKSLTYSELANIRSQAQKDTFKSTDSNVRRLGQVIVDEIDDFVNTAPNSFVISGNLPAIRQMIGEAKNLWRQKSRSENIEELIRKAKIDRKRPFDEALRDEFSALEKNEKKFFKYSPEEQEFISYVARGGKPAEFLSAISQGLRPGSPFGGTTYGGLGLGGALGAQFMPGTFTPAEAIAAGATLYGGGRVLGGVSNVLARRRAMEASAGMRGYRKEATPFPATTAPVNFLAEQERINQLGF